MKIAQIAPPWITIPPKNYGGTENVLYNLIEAQLVQGHEVTLLAPGDAKTSAKLVSFFTPSLRTAGVPWQTHLKAYYHLYKAVEYVKSQNFDIVHTHLSSTSDLYIFPLLASLATPHIMTLHSNFPFDVLQSGSGGPDGYRGDADNYYMEWASSVPMVAISEHARDGELQKGYPLNFVDVVHNGLSLAQFQPTVKQPEDYFVWLGHFIPQKGPQFAIEAAKKAGVPLVLAGTIDHYRPESISFFENEIKPQFDGQQITYVGPVDMEQKVDLLSRARGLLNPINWDEPFGMVMIEAMAVGSPVISFARGAAPELIVHQKTGFLVRDLDEMVRFIPRIGEIDRKVTRMHVERNFSASIMAEKYLKIYKKVIAMSEEGSAAFP